MAKTIRMGDTLVSAVLDSPEEIEAVIGALEYVVEVTPPDSIAPPSWINQARKTLADLKLTPEDIERMP
jgi:hypothetical protein